MICIRKQLQDYLTCNLPVTVIAIRIVFYYYRIDFGTRILLCLIGTMIVTVTVTVPTVCRNSTFIVTV